MEPYIQSIDSTKSLGKLLNDYVERRYWNGFLLGFISGIATSTTFYLVTKLIRK